MAIYRYTVLVDTDTQDHADQAMAERLDFDEDYGYGYQLKWEADHYYSETWFGTPQASMRR